MLTCLICSSEIAGRWRTSVRNSKYCSKKCRRESERRRFRYQAAVHAPGVSRTTIGAVGEMLVAADLLIRGYEVFRALSPGCSCDLAILKDGRLLRVEVRTGYRYNKLDGTERLFVNRPKRADRHDILAVCLSPSRIVYEPPLESTASVEGGNHEQSVASEEP